MKQSTKWLLIAGVFMISLMLLTGAFDDAAIRGRD